MNTNNSNTELKIVIIQAYTDYYFENISWKKI